MKEFVIVSGFGCGDQILICLKENLSIKYWNASWNEVQNQVMRQMMFTTVFIERKYHKSKTKSYLKPLQLITNSSHSYLNKGKN